VSMGVLSLVAALHVSLRCAVGHGHEVDRWLWSWAAVGGGCSDAQVLPRCQRQHCTCCAKHCRAAQRGLFPALGLPLHTIPAFLVIHVALQLQAVDHNCLIQHVNTTVVPVKT
jgi:hypothetical protein